MLGVVLCGGQSTRMGSDKGLLIYQGKPWVVHAVEKLQQVGISVGVSVNERHLPAYQHIVGAALLVPDSAGLPVRGPLLGLLSAHVHSPAEDLFVLACDLPLMESNLLLNLVRLYEQNPGYDAYLYQNDEETEPLCGIYTASALAGIVRLFSENTERRYGMKSVLRSLNVFLQPLDSSQKSSFRNFNTPDVSYDG